jgi:hypothetical protein
MNAHTNRPRLYEAVSQAQGWSKQRSNVGLGWHQILTVNQNNLGASYELFKMLLRVDRDYFCRHCDSSVVGEDGSASRVVAGVDRGRQRICSNQAALTLRASGSETSIDCDNTGNEPEQSPEA